MKMKPGVSNTSQSKKIRKGDKVIAVAGNYRGQVGVVKSCSGEKIIVEGLNLCKKHVKKSQQSPQGGIVEFEKPIHVSNLKVCVGDNTPVKLKVRHDDDGKRNLVYKQGDQEVVYRSVKKLSE